MDKQQKADIRKMRGEGFSYSKIAAALNLSENTVQSFCRRNRLGGTINSNRCRQCGQPLRQTKGAKTKIYCSDKCRMAWWNAHAEEMNRKNNQMFTCLFCGQAFGGPGKRQRKYCSRTCYGKAKAVRNE